MSSYILLRNTKKYSKICCAGNEEVIFEKDTGDDEYIFSEQGMMS
jgi:hypothetical protein